MRSPLVRWSVWFGLAAALAPLVLAGCGQGVRQDRTITWAPQGQAVGFQHDADGVFIADGAGGRLEKIFQPGPEVLVTSTPLWDPSHRRLLFTTARDANARPGAPQPLSPDFNPAGGIVHQRPVVYTCWLREEPRDGQASQPVALFEAPCDHPGYIAANLAVRWHPCENRLLYIKQVDGPRHGLFEYDLATRTSRRIFRHDAEGLIFDWTPDGSRLVCVLGNAQGPDQAAGIWVGKPQAGDWWQVPGSGDLAEAQLPSLLERLRATRPVWTADGTRFAFTTHTPGPSQEDPGRFFLRQGTPANRQVQLLAEGTAPFRDLHWAPDGTVLGVVQGRAAGSLHLVRPGEGLSAPLNREPVRQFAGWNASGEQIAYTTPDKVPLAMGPCWALLLTPDAMPRDAVLVADGKLGAAARAVFAGMRVTFPRWSPTEDKLSVWFTFSPTHRSLWSRWWGTGLRPGDPAAVLDLPTRRVTWMAVNAFEKAQVGHYHLLKREYQEAWRWYQDAEAALPPRRSPPSPSQPLLDVLAQRDFALFQALCLTKLGRDEEARQKLKQVQDAFAPPALPEANPPNPVQALFGANDPLGAALLRDGYVAEVFLSLDLTADARAFFRNALKEAHTDEDRLSHAVVLAQLLLLDGKHAEYADLVTEALGPFLFKAGATGMVLNLESFPLGNADSLKGLVGGLTVLPLCSADFLDTLTDEQLRKLLPHWREFRQQTDNEVNVLIADLFLEAACRKLGLQAEQREAAARLQANPARTASLPRGVAGAAESARQISQQLDALRQLLGGGD